MELSDVLSDEVLKTSSGDAYDDLESEIVRPGTVLEVTHVAVENRTTAYTRLVIGVADGISFLQKEEEDSPAADNIYWTEDSFLIPAGKKLRARLTGCTSGDELHMAYEGKIWRMGNDAKNWKGKPSPPNA